MQWFKHDSNTTMDFKIRKLIIKYGAIGYAIYFHCLELIAGSINENNITFELEHDSEIIADDLRIKGTTAQSGVDLVQEIMRYMVKLDLFEESNGHIFCFKLLKRLDTSMTSNQKLRDLITKAKNQENYKQIQKHDKVMIESNDNHDTSHDGVMQDQNRIDNTKLDKKTLDNTNNNCSELQKAEVEPLILNDGSEWLPTQAEYLEYLRLYPSVDIIAEFRRMRGWCNGNPSKRKTRKGISRFVNAWLGKEQDKPSFAKNNQQQNKSNWYDSRNIGKSESDRVPETFSESDIVF